MYDLLPVTYTVRAYSCGIKSGAAIAKQPLKVSETIEIITRFNATRQRNNI